MVDANGRAASATASTRARSPRRASARCCRADTPHPDRARRRRPAGARAAADGARVPAPLKGLPCRPEHITCTARPAPPPPARRARRRRARAMVQRSASPPPAHRTANRFVFVILRGGLDGLAVRAGRRRPGIRAGTRRRSRSSRARRCRSTRPSRCTRTSRSCTRCTGAANSPSCTPSACRTATARTSMRSRCSKAAARGPTKSDSGWLGRALGGSGAKGIALNTAVPLVLRGPGDGRHLGAIGTARPVGRPGRAPRAHVRERPQRSRRRSRARRRCTSTRRWPPRWRAAWRAAWAAVAALVALSCSRSARPSSWRSRRGPQAAVLEISGWDTHANQGNPNGAARQQPAPARRRPRRAARGPAGQQDAWARTVVVVATEFGREVAINGTQGTDHGTGGAAFVLGGARAGRPRASPTGRASRRRDRYDGRDLRITTDLRAVLKGVLADHLQVAERSSSARCSRAANR